MLLTTPRPSAHWPAVRQLAGHRAPGPCLRRALRWQQTDSSWLQVMLGQGIVPQDYHPLANSLSMDKINEMLKKIRKIKQEPLSQLPSHDDFLKSFCMK